MTTRAQQRPVVWVPTPPGWVEVAAFATEERARAHWRAMVEPVREEIGDTHTEELYRMLSAARETVAGARVSSAGLVLTVVSGELAVWTFSTALEHVRSGELAPAALVERAVSGRAASAEDVALPGGRTGVLARFDVTPPPAPPGAGLPSWGTASQHHCVVAAPLRDRPHDVVVVSGSSNDPRDGDLLAMATVSLAAGVEVGTTPPDTDGRLADVIETFDRLTGAGPER